MSSEYGSHNRYDNPLHTFNYLASRQKVPGEHQHSFVVVKTGLQNNFRPSTTFAAVKTVFISTSTGLQRAS